jgi:DNA-directed RNA polymerase subunit RPC12/RpoP
MQQSFVERSHQKIEHPDCARCGAPMWLTCIEPNDADHDQRTFECQACGNSKVEIVKFR